MSAIPSYIDVSVSVSLSVIHKSIYYLSPSLPAFVFLSVCHPIYLSVSLSFHVTVCLCLQFNVSVCLCLCLYVCHTIFLSVCGFVHLSTIPSICQSLSICMPVIPSTCLSFYCCPSLCPPFKSLYLSSINPSSFLFRSLLRHCSNLNVGPGSVYNKKGNPR